MTSLATLTRLTRARKTVLIPTVGLALFITALVNVLLLVMTSPLVANDFRAAVTISGQAALIPFAIGLAMVVGDSVRPRMDQFSALMNLGMRRGTIARYLALETLAICIAGSLMGAIAAPGVLWLLIQTIYAPFGVVYPPGLTPTLTGVAISFLAVAAVALVAAGLAGRRLRTAGRGGRPSNERRGRVGALVVGSFLGGLGLAYAGTLVIGAPAFGITDAFPMLLPLTSSAAAVVVLIVVSVIVDKVSVRAIGWNWLGVAMRQVRVNPATGIATLMVLVMAYPLGLFTYFNSLTIGAKVNASQSFASVPVVVRTDGTLLDAAEAASLCQSLGRACLGAVQWTAATATTDGGWGPTRAGQQERFVLHGTTAGVIDHVLTSRTIGKNTSVFGSQLWDAWYGVVDAPLPRVFGSLVAVDSAAAGGQLPAGVHAVDAHAWAAADMPDRLIFGPSGGGTREVIPMFIYLMLGCVALVFGLTMARQFGLTRTVDSLGSLGLNGLRQAAVRATVNASPSLAAIATAVACCVVMSSTVASVLAGTPQFAPPSIPLGFTMSVASLTLLAAVLPTFIPTRRARA